MKKFLGILSMSLFFLGQNIAQENVSPVAEETVAAKKSCSKTCSKKCSAAAAKAASLNDMIVEKTCEKSGNVSYFMKEVCEKSGKITETPVQFDMAKAQFVNIEALSIDGEMGAGTATNSVQSLGAKKACSKGKKGCCAKKKAAAAAAAEKSAPTSASEGTN